jgi:hypothetical protein
MKRIALVVLCVLLLVGCGGRFNYPSRSESPPIPAYPNAPDSGSGPQYDKHTIAFDTTDTPDKVQQFYAEQLPKQQKNGWQPKALPGSGAVGQTYAAIGCGQSFFLAVDAVTTDQGTTRVTLGLWAETWCH